MSKEAFKVLDAEVQRRQWDKSKSVIDLMAALYEGNLPDQYQKYFPKGDPATLINMIKLAWDDLSVSTGRWPDLRGEPQNASDAEMKRVGLFERIGHSYLQNAEPNGKLFMRELAWWLVGAGRSVMVVKPDWEKGGPVFQVRDPRHAYPRGRQSSLHQYVELYDIIFKYEMSLSEMSEMGLASAKDKDTDINGEVIEYIDKNKWMIVSDGGTVLTADHNLGIVPGWVLQTISPDSKEGLSQFKDQVTLMVSISRIFSGKMALTDRLINPVFWVRGHEGAVKIGPHVINKLGDGGEMGQLTPPTTIQIDRDVQQLTQFSRILNRNPEVRQGEVSSKGAYTSAKTLEQLSEAIDTVVGGFWDVISVGLQGAFRVAFEMDETFWANDEKTISGTRKGSRYRDKYVPSQDIAGRRQLAVDHGFGVGGYQGFLMHVQAADGGYMPRRRAIEAMPGISDVDEALREMELEQMDSAGAALFQQQAATGSLDMVLWAELRKEMARKGLPLSEVILKYQERIQEQAAQAAQQGGAEGLTTPPTPEEEVGGGGEVAPPPIPPALLAGV